jgi:hypothetical protein
MKPTTWGRSGTPGSQRETIAPLNVACATHGGAEATVPQ